ncbi:MAG: hypothetical protein HRU36_03010 [Rickettsiales bacterium]|nr:hypothetical protein [Rickettsiales bacterium]
MQQKIYIELYKMLKIKNKNSLSSYSSLLLKKTKKERGEGEKYLRGEIDTVKKLLCIWKENINCQSSFRMSVVKHRRLLCLFVRHFKSSIREWRKFVLFVKKSRFLMGKNQTVFQVSLDWILEEKNLLSILKDKKRLEYLN